MTLEPLLLPLLSIPLLLAAISVLALIEAWSIPSADLDRDDLVADAATWRAGGRARLVAGATFVLAALAAAVLLLCEVSPPVRGVHVGGLAGLVALAVLGWRLALTALRARIACSHLGRLERARAEAREAFTSPPAPVEDCTAWKLARIRGRAGELWLEGVAGGHYGAHAEAECLDRGEHLVPDPECSCGFHAWRSAELARCYLDELTWAENPAEVALCQVELAGDILEYEDAFRAQIQSVLGLTLPRCSCGEQVSALVPTPHRGSDLYAATCAECATSPGLPLADAAGRLGVEITPG